MNSQIKIITALALSLPFLGCDTSKKLTTMHDSTVRMDRTTQDMNQSTKKMGTTMDGMNETMGGMNASVVEMTKTTDALSAKMENLSKKMDEMSQQTGDLQTVNAELYQVAKHGSSMELRRNSLKALRESKQLSKKIAEAMKYFMAFEYQIWMNHGEDNLEKRESLQFDATLEFFAEVAEFVTDSSLSVNPVSVSDKEENLSFVALGVALEAIDQRQVNYLKKNKDLKPVTMLSMIESALQMSGTDLPAWAREIKNNELLALRLLNGRMNGYTLMFLGRAGGLQYSVGRQFTTVLLHKNIKLNLDSLNNATLSEYTRYLNEATRTRTLLKSFRRGNSSLDEKMVKMLLDLQINGGLGRVSSEVKDTMVVKRASLETELRQATHEILR